MIKPLRKYHYMFWWLLAILLPIAFVMAIALRPDLPASTKGNEEPFAANITVDTDSTLLVTILVAKPIKVPSCLAILLTSQKELVLGTLNRQGRYSFIVPAFDGTATLNLVDAIHQKTIANIPLSKNTITQ